MQDLHDLIALFVGPVDGDRHEQIEIAAYRNVPEEVAAHELDPLGHAALGHRAPRSFNDVGAVEDHAACVRSTAENAAQQHSLAPAYIADAFHVARIVNAADSLGACQ